MTQYIAKPNMNTDTGMKTFNIESDAIKYLEEYTGYEEIVRQVKRQVIGI